MTPAARIAAAIGVLDQILDGTSSEKALTGWARSSRYAGSKDRAAVRDHVFDAVRNKRTYAHLGGAETGRAIMLGCLLSKDLDPAKVFTSDGYGPSALAADEIKAVGPMPDAVASNLPDWVYRLLKEEMGDGADHVAALLSERAPICLRVNTLKSTLENVVKLLSDKGIATKTFERSKTAIVIDGDVRGLRNTSEFLDGWYEFQDAASQALVDDIPLSQGDRVLDYCAGGGGKTLALAARLDVPVVAHDANPDRLKDLPVRAKRAGAKVEIGEPDGEFDVVLCDAPCSGSGAWRRAPDGKWGFTKQSLQELINLQDQILDTAAQFVSPNGHLVYATCSVLLDENERRVEAFLERNPSWNVIYESRFDITKDNDGFYTAHFKHH